MYDQWHDTLMKVKILQWCFHFLHIWFLEDTREGICIVIVRQTFACDARTFSKALSAKAVKMQKSS